MMIALAERGHLDGLVGLEALFEPGQRWSEATWLGEFGHDDRHLLVALDGSEPDVVGAAVFRQADDVVDLDRIAVAPAWRGHGLARAMVTAGVEWARSRDAARVLLEVHRDNHPAIRLYRSHGFRAVAQRDNYYGAGQHASIMELQLRKEGGP